MNILLSKRNFIKESLALIDSVQKQSAKVTVSSGLTFEVDWFKLSLLSPLLRSIKESLCVPESLNHLLDINIIFPDFSEEALALLNKSFTTGFGSDMRVRMTLYEEIQLLVNTLGISLHPSLSLLEDTDIQEIRCNVDADYHKKVKKEVEDYSNENQFKTDMNSNKTEINTEKIVVKVEPKEVVITDFHDDELEGHLMVDESACASVGGTPIASPSFSKCVSTIDGDVPELPADNLNAELIFTHSAEDRNGLRNELRKLMVTNVNSGRKLWSCTMCDFEKEAATSLFRHLDSKHTPHILHQCVLCFKMFKTQVLLRSHLVKQHASSEVPIEDSTPATKNHSFEGSSASTSTANNEGSFEESVMTDNVEDREKLRKIWRKYISREQTEDGRKFWKCLLCGDYEKESERNLFQHIDSNHTPNILHQCHFCQHVLKTNKTLRQHIVTKHSDIADIKGNVSAGSSVPEPADDHHLEMDIEATPAPTAREDLPKKVLTLDSDDRKVFKKTMRKLTLARKEGDKTIWSCTVCKDYEKDDERRMFDHIDSLHLPNISFKCLICWNLFPTQSALKKHRDKEHKQVESKSEKKKDLSVKLNEKKSKVTMSKSKKDPEVFGAGGEDDIIQSKKLPLSSPMTGELPSVISDSLKSVDPSVKKVDNLSEKISLSKESSKPYSNSTPKTGELKVQSLKGSLERAHSVRNVSTPESGSKTPHKVNPQSPFQSQHKCFVCRYKTESLSSLRCHLASEHKGVIGVDHSPVQRQVGEVKTLKDYLNATTEEVKTTSCSSQLNQSSCIGDNLPVPPTPEVKSNISISNTPKNLPRQPHSSYTSPSPQGLLPTTPTVIAQILSLSELSSSGSSDTHQSSSMFSPSSDSPTTPGTTKESSTTNAVLLASPVDHPSISQSKSRIQEGGRSSIDRSALSKDKLPVGASRNHLLNPESYNTTSEYRGHSGRKYNSPNNYPGGILPRRGSPGEYYYGDHQSPGVNRLYSNSERFRGRGTGGERH